MVKIDLFGSRSYKRARIEDDYSAPEENQGVARSSNSEVQTDASEKVSQADIKYVNVLYNTKHSQNGLSEGPTLVEKEVSLRYFFQPDANTNSQLFLYLGPDQNHEMGSVHSRPVREAGRADAQISKGSGHAVGDAAQISEAEES